MLIVPRLIPGKHHWLMPGYYNIPSASGVSLEPEQIAALSEVGVKYMKDTSGNGPALTELLFQRTLVKHINKATR